MLFAHLSFRLPAVWTNTLIFLSDSHFMPLSQRRNKALLWTLETQRASRSPLLPQFTSSLNSSCFTFFPPKEILLKPTTDLNSFSSECEMNRGGSINQKPQYATFTDHFSPWSWWWHVIPNTDSPGGNPAISFGRHHFTYMMLMCWNALYSKQAHLLRKMWWHLHCL